MNPPAPFGVGGNRRYFFLEIAKYPPIAQTYQLMRVTRMTGFEGNQRGTLFYGLGEDNQKAIAHLHLSI